MFMSLESIKKRKKDAANGEKLPLTRSHSLYNAQKDKYPIVPHSPPLIVHTPDANRKVYQDNYRITKLLDSPSMKRTSDDNNSETQGSETNFNRIDRLDFTDVKRPKSSKQKRPYNGNNNNEEYTPVRTTKRTNVHTNYRRRKYRSPAPIEDARRPAKQKLENGTTPRSARTMSIGMLDSNPNSDIEDEPRKKKEILAYFAQLGCGKNSNEKIDLQKIVRLLSHGANINATDKYGQTVMHEIVRNWHTDIARYMIGKGALLDNGDKYGRTALHLASAVGHTDMIEFLVQNKARLHARTVEEKQTPLHFAARNNAVESLRVLLKLGASVNDRDYRLRTPLYIAAENGRVEAALYLLRMNAPAAVYDDQGVSCLSIMVQRMPNVALIALQQFYTEDPSHRKLYCFLNYLENKLTPEEENQINWKYLPKYERQKQKREMSLVSMISAKEIKKTDLVKSVLERIVEHNEVQLVVHPAIKLLIEKKWLLCGRRSTLFGVFINILYAMIWSTVFISTKLSGVEIYQPFSSWWYVIVLEVIGVGMTIFFMVTHVMEDQIIKRRSNAYRAWQVGQMERDLKFCHPRWPEEKRHITESVDMANDKKQSRCYSNAWNCFDWFVYALIFIVMATRILTALLEDDAIRYFHMRTFSVVQIFIWLRMVRRLRPFPFFGPFIVMLSHVAWDTMILLVLFLTFFIPYSCAFWMIFGDVTTDVNGKQIQGLIYTIFQMSVVGRLEWSSIPAKDKTMAQLLTGTYVVIVCLVCVSIYIALLANTFSRVYPQAKARALLIQAAKILFAERIMSKRRKLNMRAHIHEDCAPQISDLHSENITIATNITTVGHKEFNRWKDRSESNVYELKTCVKELQSKQDKLLHHFKLILHNMDDEEDLVDEI